MKAEGYELALYCDNAAAHPDNWRRGYSNPSARRFPVEFCGPTRRFCMRNAREAGWTLGRKDYCPLCTKARVGSKDNSLGGRR